MDINKTVQVLQDQIEKLNAKDFDLNAWKNFTILLLERIFGPGNQKIQAIQKLGLQNSIKADFHMDSWLPI